MKSIALKLSEIVTTAGTQIRAKVDPETVENYAAEMREGAKFPPVDVFHGGSQYIAADGFHRIMAASRNGFKDILASVHKGTKSDALKFALSANCAHGLKRTNADKRRSVELALSEWPTLSDRELARICAVSNNFVGEVRASQLSSDDSSTPPSRVGMDGKTRKVPNRQPNPPDPSKPHETPSLPPDPVSPPTEPRPEREEPVAQAAKNLKKWRVMLEELQASFSMLPPEFKAEFLKWAKEN